MSRYSAAFKLECAEWLAYGLAYFEEPLPNVLADHLCEVSLELYDEAMAVFEEVAL